MKFSKPLRIIRNLLLFFFISTAVTVVVYSFMPVYVTPLMVIRSVQQIFKGESPAWHHEWIPFNEISPHLPMAVIASEDNRFATHNGFDFIEIRKAMKENEKRKRKRGASTISQQTAKNVLHVDDRTVLVQKADYDGLPQLHRNGQRHLRGASRSPV